jgi:sec-independent protein translocase protein TatB
MFDIGWQELFIVAVIGIIVIGPKELPRTLRAVTGALRKVRSMASEFQSGIDDVVREAELEDIKKSVTGSGEFDFENEIKETLDPTGDLEKDIQGSLDEEFDETDNWDEDDDDDDEEYYDYEGDDSTVNVADAEAVPVDTSDPVSDTEDSATPAATPDTTSVSDDTPEPEPTKQDG